ncbi:MAG: DsbA family protein [Candidatus Peregrinibacteria bacterium]
MNNKGIIAAIIVGAVLVAGGLVFNGLRTASNDDIKAAVIAGLNEFVSAPDQAVADDSAANAETPVVDMEKIINDDDAVLGDENAPVTIVEFSEFQCPYCEKFYSAAYQDIKTNYVESGKVKIVFKHFPLGFHAGAYPAALATECVREQGGNEMFFAMHDAIFDDNSILSGDESSIKDDLAALAKKVGANMTKYNSCIASDKYKDEIESDIAAGQSVGISGTPSFVINGELVVGAFPYSEFESIIEGALAK